MPPHPLDDDLPPITIGNLSAFCAQYYSEAETNGLRTDEYGPHTVFALTGHCTINEQPHRMRLDPHTMDVQPFRLSQVSDIDSVIGFVHKGDTFPLTMGHSVFFNVFNNTDFTLRSNLHLPAYEFKDAFGDNTVSPPDLSSHGHACLPRPLLF